MVIFVGEGGRFSVFWRRKRPSTLTSCSSTKLTLGKLEGAEAKKSNSIQANVLVKPAVGECNETINAICEGCSLCFSYVREVLTYNLEREGFEVAVSRRGSTSKGVDKAKCPAPSSAHNCKCRTADLTTTSPVQIPFVKFETVEGEILSGQPTSYRRSTR